VPGRVRVARLDCGIERLHGLEEALLQELSRLEQVAGAALESVVLTPEAG